MNTAYDSGADATEQLNECHLLPETIAYVMLKDEENTVQESLKDNSGKWHKTCRLKLS